MTSIALLACGSDKPKTIRPDAGVREMGMHDGDVTDMDVVDVGDSGRDGLVPIEGCRVLGAPIALGTVTPPFAHGVAVGPGYASLSPAGIDAVWVEGSVGSESMKRRRFSTTTGEAVGEAYVTSQAINAMDPLYRMPVLAQDSTVGMLAYTSSIGSSDEDGGITYRHQALVQHVDGDGALPVESAQVVSDRQRLPRALRLRAWPMEDLRSRGSKPAPSRESAKTVAYLHLDDAGVIDYGPARWTETGLVASLVLAHSRRALRGPLDNDFRDRRV